MLGLVIPVLFYWTMSVFTVYPVQFYMAGGDISVA